MSGFDKFAGQEIASGVRKNEPIMAFEEEATATKLANIAAVQGLLGIEHIGFMDGAVNAKQSGRCVPYGNAAAVGQLDVINLAWSLNISVWDREISQNVFSAAEVGDYVAQKLRTPYKTLAGLKRNAEIQLVSDVIDGTRSVSSHESSDGTGNSVTYAPNIKGYAGQIADTGIVMPALTQGSLPAFANASDAMSLVKTLQDRAAEMMEEGTSYSKLGINTFCMEAPLLIMETRVLNALDNAWALDGAAKQTSTVRPSRYLPGPPANSSGPSRRSWRSPPSPSSRPMHPTRRRDSGQCSWTGIRSPNRSHGTTSRARDAPSRG